MTIPSSSTRVPRALHPIAWWVWAIGMVAAVSRTTNPLLLVLVLAVLGFVIANRRSDAPWARAFKYYLILALVIIAIRIVFRTVFASGASAGDHILFSLPHVDTPHWYAGIQLGGPISLEALLAATFDGLRLGTLLCCIGAANVLANPKRALRVLPGALYELGVAVTVALSVAPQLVESLQRVNRARKLRGGGKGLRAVRSVVIPVLEDALERSMQLAAGMDSRGYGRSAGVGRRTRRVTALLMLLGMCGLCVGLYGLVDGTAPPLLGPTSIVAGVVLCGFGFVTGERRVRRTAYRPDPWRVPEWVVAGGGVACAVLVVIASLVDVRGLTPSTSPLAWPPLPVVPAFAILLAAAAAMCAPPPVRRRPAPRPPAPTKIQREKVTV